MMAEYEYERQPTFTSDESNTSNTSRSSRSSISTPLSTARKINALTSTTSAMSSGSSVSSKLSRHSRKSLAKNAPELGDCLLSSALEDEYDHGNNVGNHGNGDSYENGNGPAHTALSGNELSASSPTSAISPTSVNGGGIINASNSMNTSNISNGRTGGFADDDPFYMFRGDLVKKLLLVEEELGRYLNVVQTTDTAVNTHQIKEIKKQLKRHIKHAESTLTDLETTVRVVEKSREKFLHISHDELSNRRSFVRESRERIVNARGEMQGEEVKDKFLRDERSLAERRKGGGSNGGIGAKVNPLPTKEYARSNSDNSNGESTDFLSSERSETILMMQQQDETLESLDHAVTRVGYMAETIHEEIGQQNKMLSDLEDDLADAEEQLGMVMGKLAKLLKTKNKCQLGLIVVLSLIVLLLFFLVIYT